MHVNPIHSRPFSPSGRENYDRIFRKSPLERMEKHVAKLEEMGRDLREAYQEKKINQARELYHEMARQKHIDESA